MRFMSWSCVIGEVSIDASPADLRPDAILIASLIWFQRLAVVRLERPALVALWVMRVVDHAIDHGGVVSADGDHKPPHGEVAVAQMDFAPGPDRHRRNPFEAKLAHIVLEPLALDSDPISSARRLLGSAPAYALRPHPISKTLIDFGVSLSARNCYGAAHTVARRAFEVCR